MEIFNRKEIFTIFKHFHNIEKIAEKEIMESNTNVPQLIKEIMY